MPQQAISGAYVKVLYEFEDSYGYPTGGVSEESLKGITRVLGHGVRVDSWSKDNGLRALTGLNNVEPSDIVDGPFNGSFSVSFAAIADVAWLKAIMGYELNVSDSNPVTRKYTKSVAPPSMTFAIYMNNDSEEPTYGDAFLVTGVVVSNVSFSIESGDNPVQVSMECVYKTEYKYDNVIDIPMLNTPTDHVFNYSMVNAYFWNPGTDIDGAPSFDSIECTIDRVNFSIRHTANLLRGIGTRVAKNKVHANIEYDMSMTAVFSDPKKFLEKFYGCVNTPAKYLAPFEQVSIVIENFFRDSQHAKLMFGFKNVKIKSDSLPLAIENVIMEEMSLLPISCDITVERGCPNAPSVSLSPSVIQKGDILYFYGANFVPGDTITISSGLFTIDKTVGVNCLGELEYAVLIPDTTTSRQYSIDITAPLSYPNDQYTLYTNVIAPEDLMANTAICKKLIHTPTGALPVDSFVLTGYNFSRGVNTVYIQSEIYDAEARTWATEDGVLDTISGIIGGTFSYDGEMSLISGSGVYRIESCTKTGGNKVDVAYSDFFSPNILTSTLSADGFILTVNGGYIPPGINVKVDYIDGALEETVIPIGTHAVNSRGWMPGGTTRLNDDEGLITYVRSKVFPFTDGVSKVRFTISGINSNPFIIERKVWKAE